MRHPTQYVEPIRPIAPYLGGKRLLAPKTVEAIEGQPHATYCEPFVGMGGIFFRRRLVPRVEVINDINRDLITLFRIIQRHYKALMDFLRWHVSSRSDFERLAAIDHDCLTDIERAARFLYLQRLAFGGKIVDQTFGISPCSPARFSTRRIGGLIENIHARLADVWIECLPWQEFIQRWDRKSVLFYLDPPYWGSEDYYGRNLFQREDFETLAGVLKGLRGRFVLTINDVQGIRRLFSWANIETVTSGYSLARSERRGKAKQLIISSP